MKKWHSLPVSEVVKILKTNCELGLTSEEARRRLKLYGPNEIPEEKRFTVLRILLDQIKSLLVWLLIFATIASIMIGEISDAFAISVILILNIILGFVQEYRAEKAVELLKKLATPKARVIRNGIETEVPSTEVVPGDIVVLRAGDRVPADLRLIKCVNLKVDESLLTGESIPVEKITDPLPEDVSLPERRNMVFMATTVTYGRGKGVVVATGVKTEFGKIAESVRKEEREITPLQRKMEHLGRVLTGIIVALVFLVLLEEIMEGLDVYEALMTSISLAVSAVPEGLPAVLAITLALGVQKMARRNAIVRRLSSVETLGSATVICTDKTGTLTKNEMTVVRVFVNREFIKVTGSGYEPKGEFLSRIGKVDPLRNPTFKKLLEICLLCNDSKLIQENGSWRIIGDPTEGALIVLAVKSGLKEDLRKNMPRFSEVPFDSTRKRMSTAHLMPNGKKVLYLKGAPDVVLKLCNRIEEHGDVRTLTENDKSVILEATSSMAKEALRVLAIAYKELDSGVTKINETDEKDLIFVGLVGMIDPPRPEVPRAIKVAKEAGIKVVMVTGDHKDTAISIARQIGIIEDSDDDSLVLTGSELDKMTDDELYEVANKVVVYARVSPEHKLRIIRALKRRGHIVAMTGDGINDAPSVKAADIGIAMGIRGSDVTREVADLVLADDNFATIIVAIEEGRTIYDNIRKFIRLLLSANWDEIGAVFVSAMLDLPLPFTPAQILWINLVTDGLPALALGVDPPEPGVMKRPPRNPKEKVYSGMELFFLVSIILALISWIVPFWYALRFLGKPLSEARTIAFSQAVIFELILSLNSRSEERFVFKSLDALFANKHLILAVLVSLALQLAVLYLPPLQYIFNTTPLDLIDWGFIILFGSLSVLLYPKIFDTRKIRNKIKVILSS